MYNTIDSLPLSNRAKNALKRNNIHTVDELNSLTTRDVMFMKSIGKVTLNEINDYINKGNIYNDINKYGDDIIFYFKYNDSIVDDIRIDLLKITPRVRQILETCGFDTASKIIKSQYNIPKLRRAQINVLIYNINKYAIFRMKHDYVTSQAEKIKNDIDNSFMSSFCLISLGEIIESYKDNEFDIKSLFIKYFLEALTKVEYISMTMFDERPSSIISHSDLDNILNELVSIGKITIVNNKIYYNYISIPEYLEQINQSDLDSRYKDMINLRRNGSRLSAIADKDNMSRERVRQVINKYFNFNLKFKESRFISYYEQYNISKKDFMKIFDISEISYNCFFHFLSKGKASINDLLKDPTLSSDQLDRLSNIIGKVFINDRDLISKYDVFMNFMKENFSNSAAHLDTIYETFNEYMVKNNAANYTYNSIRSIENIFTKHNFKNLLTCGSHTYRYYDKTDEEVYELLDCIDFTKYDNLEISTLKIYMDYLKLMLKYNIQNEYELYTIIKHYMDNKTFKFGKCPILKFGHGSRIDQANKLIDDYKPISQKDFVNMYNKLYGIVITTIYSDIVPLVKHRYIGKVYI